MTETCDFLFTIVDGSDVQIMSFNTSTVLMRSSAIHHISFTAQSNGDETPVLTTE